MAQQIVQLVSFRDSRFWKQIEACESVAQGDARRHIETLKANVAQVAEQAK